MFASYESHLGRSKREKLSDPKTWHNLFHRHIVSQIDEARFAGLFDKTQGRPNAPVRILLGMIFLKEGYQWSDEELFEQCGYNLLVMRALGLVNLDEQVPAPSTYYLFKQQVFAYDVAQGVDLVGQIYDELTEGQAHHFGVRADYIRMDSKLFGSNIANCCRLQLIVGCLSAFWKALEPGQRMRTAVSDRRVLDALLEKKPHQVVYGLKEPQKATKLQELGMVLERLVRLYSDSGADGYEQVARVFHEHYTVVSKQIVLKPPKDVAATSLQSPHDPDAAYCCKPGQKVKGYKASITETCNPDGLNLITDVQVAPATQGDPGFVVPAIEKTESVVGVVKEVSMDGSYHHPKNQEYAADSQNKKKLHIAGMPGYASRFTYDYTDQGVAVTDTRTGEHRIAAEFKPGRYRVVFDKCYYFTDVRIQSYLLRKQVEEMPDEVRKRRNNVEATIYHISCCLKKSKSRYRGIHGNRLWATSRAVWVNLIRIRNFLASPQPVPVG
jgi:hypothetical protein|tara:strand:+ start:241 stop:1731 length:1491 start_codon:yes stop_codon:yes gene_type:complete